jgi:hypothetical protein
MAFVFVDSVDQLCGPDVYLADLPPALRTKEQLLDALSAALRFPSYFGRNWDALDECIQDLGWIAEKKVVLHHSGVPLRDDIPNLRIYLDILSLADRHWQTDPLHGFVVAFGRASEAKVRKLAKGPV